MIGRVPLIPLFLAGNLTPTIPHQYSQHKRSGFPVGSCDSAAADGRRGSHVYEVNPWLWQFGRGKPRLGGLSVAKTGAKKAAAQKEWLLRGAETRRRRKADRAWWEMKCGCEHAQTCLYNVQTYINIYVHVCTMYIQLSIFINMYVLCIMYIHLQIIMYMYVHIFIFMYMYIPCTYMLIPVCKLVNMYVHVCTMFRHVCTDLPILVQVVRIPDDVVGNTSYGVVFILHAISHTI